MENISELNQKNYRDFYSMQELVNVLRRTVKVWSWGANGWTKMSNKLLRFKVQGYHHKGHVYIAVNDADLFDVFLTTITGKVKKEINDVYREDLIDVIDKEVEYIPEYGQK